MIFRKKFILVFLLSLLQIDLLRAQKADSSLFSFLRWRMIGPYRAGRTVGASGDLQHPNVFYIGVNNGGVWKTTDYGRTWAPIFDDQPTGSIGDVAVAPSNPNIVYVASGEGLQRPDLSVGDGMYRSADAGKTWKHIGLSEGWQIGGIAVDPKNENRVFAAVLGHPYGPNKERGVYRTTDGGNSWEQVLFIDENTGAVQVTIDPADSGIVYADMFAGRLAPWENGMWAGPKSGLFKSIDGGKTWKQLKTGLPATTDGMDRIGFCIAPSDHNRLYAVVNASQKNGGFYRSDNAGESWTKMSGDTRLWERGTDFAEVKVDPKNADIVYDANVVVWKSTDGGKNWNGWKGAPGGDDYHRLWINPNNTDVILLASDQGAGITVNGGETWSSWYNQPTAQLYHVSADNDFPYNVYGGQQESGSVGIASRSNDGAITFRDWHPVGAQEYGYVVADPKNPDIIYGGKLSRYDKRTGQTQDISPKGKYRFLRTAPVVFSPVDNTTLFYAGNILLKTRDGGNSWKEISPDLTRTSYDVAECIGIFRTDSMGRMPQRGVIYTIAPSPLDSNIIWAGTDDGLIHVTHNGGTSWQNVTPPGLTSWSKISLMDASHTDKNTAYAAVNRIRLDDLRPHIYRTMDGGKIWQEIVNGLPNEPINVVKEDPMCKGLLFAGSERAVYVSFDDGDNWQSLRMNMPATSIRDLVIKDNDLVVATHGRSFWIMDDIMSLREVAFKSRQDEMLYPVAPAYRVRWNMWTDTPLPPDEPAGENPPDGAIVEYYLKERSNLELWLGIYYRADNGEKEILCRTISSKDTMYTVPDVNIPLYWIRPQQKLSTEAGAHRFVWDLREDPLDVPASYPISAIYKNTPPVPTSPLVMPGHYIVRISINGHVKGQSLDIMMDPRVKTSESDLKSQYELSHLCYADMKEIIRLTKDIKASIAELKTIGKDKKEAKKIDKLLGRANELISGRENFTSIYGSLSGAFNTLQGADVAPTTQCRNAANEAHMRLEAARIRWQELEKEIQTVPEIKRRLEKDDW